MSAQDFIAIAMKNRRVEIEVVGDASSPFEIDDITDVDFADEPAPSNKGTLLNGAGYATTGFSSPAEIDISAAINHGLQWPAGIARARRNGSLIEVTARTPARKFRQKQTGDAGFTAATNSPNVAQGSGTQIPAIFKSRGAFLAKVVSGTLALVGVIEKLNSDGSLVLAENAKIALADGDTFAVGVPGYQIPTFVAEILLWNPHKKEGEGAAAIQVGTLQILPISTIGEVETNLLGADGNTLTG